MQTCNVLRNWGGTELVQVASCLLRLQHAAHMACRPALVLI